MILIDKISQLNSNIKCIDAKFLILISFFIEINPCYDTSIAVRGSIIVFPLTMPDHQSIPKPLIPQTQSSENDYTAKNNQPFHYLKYFNSIILNWLNILI